MRLRSIALAAALLASAPARAATPASPKAATPPSAAATAALPAPSRWTLDARASVEGGAFDGLGVRTDSGGLLLTEVALTPERKAKGFTLAFPFRLSHRQTFGASLNETAGSLAVEPTWRVGRKTELGLEAGASGALRPDWPDLYQLGLPGTDRYSYLAWHGGVSYWTRIGGGKHVRLKARYVQTKYVEDPNFEPSLNPMHLTPRDNGRFELAASWRVIKDDYALGFRLDLAHRQDFTLLARDAGSGATNYATESPNPKQKLEQAEPSVQLDLRPLGGTKVTLEYGWQVQVDSFQGYYSYLGHHPTVRVSHAFGPKVDGSLRLEGWFRRYGPDSKTGTQTDDGQRLKDNRALARAELAYALGGGLALTGKAEYVRRASNYKDYVPGSSPTDTSFYDIQWDYTNLAAVVGVEWRN